VIVESPHGWIKVKALLLSRIPPDVVMGLHGWWQGCDELECRAIRSWTEARTPISCTAPTRSGRSTPWSRHAQADACRGPKASSRALAG